MDIKTVLDIADKVANQMAYQYHQNSSDLLSHCHGHIPALMTRINPDRPEKSQVAYVRSSLRGYILHYMRDNVAMIRTPRGKPPITISGLHENIPSPTPLEIEEFPEWVQVCLEHRVYGRRFANAFMRWYDS